MFELKPDIKRIGAVGKGTSGASAEALRKLDDALVYAQALAARIRERMSRDADTGGVAAPYSARPVKIRISRAYQRAVGLPGDRVVWRGSKAFHDAAGIRAGTFKGTGGMWRGLRVRNKGTSATVTDLVGETLGQSIRWKKPLKEIASARRAELKRIKRMKDGRRKDNAREKLKGYFDKYMVDANQVSGNKKALAALRKGVHVLKPKPSELAALSWSLQSRALDAAVLHTIDSLTAAKLGAVASEIRPVRPFGDEPLRRVLADLF